MPALVRGPQGHPLRRLRAGTTLATVRENQEKIAGNDQPRAVEPAVGQYSTDGNHHPFGSRYSPSVINVIGLTTRRRCDRHQRKNSPLRVGSRKASDSAV